MPTLACGEQKKRKAPRCGVHFLTCFLLAVEMHGSSWVCSSFLMTPLWSPKHSDPATFVP
eukprot:scaffold99657_cov21-Tisochrysis_lutea.AAC.1